MQGRDVITSRQLTIVVISAILGIDGFVMPRMVAQVAGRDGWISLIMAGLWILFITGGLAYLASLFPQQSPIDWLSQLFGKWIAGGMILVLILFYLLMSAWVLRTFCDMTKVYLLPRTPPEVIMITLLLSVAYLVGHGINPMVRVTQIFFPFIIIPFVTLSAMFPSRIDLKELLPILTDGVMPVFKGFPPSVAVFIGWGIILFIIQFMSSPGEAVKANAIGIGLLWVFFLWSFIASLGHFGPIELQLLLYPIIDLVRELEGPATFIEKLDLFLLTFWIMTIFITVAFTYYVPVLAGSQLLKLKELRTLVYPGLPLVFFLARLPEGIMAAEELGIWLGHGSLALSLLVPVIVIWALFKMRRGGWYNAGQA